jgi:hypothetical protein
MLYVIIWIRIWIILWWHVSMIAEHDVSYFNDDRISDWGEEEDILYMDFARDDPNIYLGREMEMSFRFICVRKGTRLWLWTWIGMYSDKLSPKKHKPKWRTLITEDENFSLYGKVVACGFTHALPWTWETLSNYGVSVVATAGKYAFEHVGQFAYQVLMRTNDRIIVDKKICVKFMGNWTLLLLPSMDILCIRCQR